MATIPLIVPSTVLESQTTPTTFDSPSQKPTYDFDRWGWPINPATNQSYSQQELIDNDRLPLPKDKLAAYIITNKRLGIPFQPKRKKAKRTYSRTNGSKRNHRASDVLMRRVGMAMAEMVDRVNGREVEEVEL